MVPSRSLTASFVPLLVGVVLAGQELSAQLPSDAGQVWKTYDISPFVAKAGKGSQKHVVDWILQDTGYGSWHGETVAALSANEKSLQCFHTAAMQLRVEAIVQRFVQDASTPHRFSVRVLGVGSPAWRNDARAVLRPIPAVTPGVQAWLMSREEAAILVATLRRRTDCQELPTGPVQAANGLPVVLSGGRQREYVQDVVLQPNVPPGWQVVNATCDEGLALDVHPLMSQDGLSVEAVLRCRIDQVERMAPVSVTVPVTDRPRVQVAVPQMSAVRIGERFRWPSSQVLVVGLGLVPWPVPVQNAAATAALLSTANRTDVVVVVEPRLSGTP